MSCYFRINSPTKSPIGPFWIFGAANPENLYSAKYSSRNPASFLAVKGLKPTSLTSTSTVMLRKSSPETPCCRICAAGPLKSREANQALKSETVHATIAARPRGAGLGAETVSRALHAGASKRNTKQFFASLSQWSTAKRCKLTALKSIVMITARRHSVTSYAYIIVELLPP